MERKNPDTLVTGGTGLIGRWLLVALTRRGREVVALVRNAEARGDALRAFVTTHGGDASKLQLVEGDLLRDDLGLRQSMSTVEDVFHCAGRYAWGMTESEARAVNVDGTTRVTQWAAGLPSLRRLVYLGGYRMTRIPSWVGAEFPMPAATRTRMYREFGAYEASGIEAHVAVRQIAQDQDLPLTIVSPATVAGDSRTGETTQYTGVADSVAMLWRGQMPAGVGNDRTFVPLVPVDHLADVLATVVDNPDTLGQELVVLDPDTPTLPGLLRSIADHLGVKAPRFNLPLGLVQALPERLTGVIPETLSFLSEDRYDLESAQQHAQKMGLKLPDHAESTRRWVDFMVSTRFGEAPQAEIGRFAAIAGSSTFVVGDRDRADTVFLHGLPWDSQSGRPLARRLHGEVVRPDLPGLGRSSAATVDGLDWLHEFLQHRTDPVRIVAHSWGAGLALRYAMSHPDRVESLVMISPYFVQARASAALRCAHLGSAVFRHAKPERLQQELLGEPGPPGESVRSAAAQLRRGGVARRTATTLAAASRTRHRRMLQDQLAALQVPSLIVHGSRDPLIQPVQQPVVTISDAGHNPHITHPIEVAQAIERWQAVSTASLSPPPLASAAASRH